MTVARGGERLLVEAHVEIAQRRPEARLDDLADRFERHGGHVVLELLQLDDELRREHVAAGARDLSELDEARSEVLQDEARALVDRDAPLLLLPLLDLLGRDLGRLAGRVGGLVRSLVPVLVLLARTAEARAGDDLAEAVAHQDAGNLAQAGEIAHGAEDRHHRASVSHARRGASRFRQAGPQSGVPFGPSARLRRDLSLVCPSGRRPACGGTSAS
jgi:hypothetical protein